MTFMYIFVYICVHAVYNRRLFIHSYLSLFVKYMYEFKKKSNKYESEIRHSLFHFKYLIVICR